MTVRAQNDAWTVVLTTLVQLISFGFFSPVFAETNQRQLTAIPSQVLAVLGCDPRIQGNGTGLGGKAAEMLGGYAPASAKKGSAISVFWCALGPQRFLLTFVRDGRLAHPECPPILAWPYVPKAEL